MKDFMIQINANSKTVGAKSIVFQDIAYDVLVDGEVYNQQLLFQELKVEYVFEENIENCIFYAYQKWGMEAMAHLEGAYAFAIVSKEKTIVVKDPMGLRPIFYAQDAGTITISNSIKTILNESNLIPTLSTNGILELFTFGPSISEDKTLFDDIKALPMGSYIEVLNGNIQILEYYQLPLREHTDTFDETTQQVHDLLTHSIVQQSVNCEASFLSGGLDSSILTAISAKNHKYWRTYSLDYEGNKESFKENVYQVSLDNEYIDQMIERYKSDHTYYMLSQQTLADCIEEAMRARNLPGMGDVDSSLLWLCKQTAQHVKNIMSGECGDELFGGYPWFYREELKDLNTFPWLRSMKERIYLLHEDLRQIDYERYCKSQYEASCAKVKYLESDSEEDRRARLHTYLCLHWFMQTLVTRQVVEGDQAGLNIRAPFANVKLLEYVYNIPWSMKFYQQQEKGILRKAFENELPKDVCWRKKNPFPKTHNPLYATIIANMLKERYDDPTSSLHVLFDDTKLLELIETKGASYPLPWYGQLMSGPQLLAYLYQIDCWIREYHIQIKL